MQLPVQSVRISMQWKRRGGDIIHRIVKRSIHGRGKIWTKMKGFYHLGRFHRPIGTFLLVYPSYWSMLLGSPESLPWECIALFTVGAFAMRGAGCTINDMWDADIDKKVKRTRSRPIAAGTVTKLEALGFLGVQAAVGAAVLFQLPPSAITLGICSLPLVIMYPLAKRFTGYPQVILGLTFNWGALLGYAAVQPVPEGLSYIEGLMSLPDIPVSIWSLYGSCFCWTLIYDTLYAHQDIKDDRAIGVGSMAVSLGKANTKPVLAGLAGMTTVGLAQVGGFHDLHHVYYLAVGYSAARLIQQIYHAKLDDPKDLDSRFTSNHVIGVVIAAGILASNLIGGRKKDSDKSKEGKGGNASIRDS